MQTKKLFFKNIGTITVSLKKKKKKRRYLLYLRIHFPCKKYKKQLFAVLGTVISTLFIGNLLYIASNQGVISLKVSPFLSCMLFFFSTSYHSKSSYKQTFCSRLVTLKVWHLLA